MYLLEPGLLNISLSPEAAAVDLGRGLVVVAVLVDIKHLLLRRQRDQMLLWWERGEVLELPTRGATVKTRLPLEQPLSAEAVVVAVQAQLIPAMVVAVADQGKTDLRLIRVEQEHRVRDTTGEPRLGTTELDQQRAVAVVPARLAEPEVQQAGVAVVLVFPPQ